MIAMANVGHAEAEIYRKALIDLYVQATNTQDRKTMDKTEIARITSDAMESGRKIFQRNHAECRHATGVCNNPGT